MLIKAGVDISRLHREIRRSLNPVNDFVENFQEELKITSTYEGNHRAGSLHYADEAYDFKRPLTLEEPTLNLLREMLGPDFDVVWKADHIHVEYDPEGE